MLIPSNIPPAIRAALGACRPHYVTAAVLSGLANLLYLTPTLFMIQVYDRVVPTGQLTTLLLLGAMALSAYVTLGIFEWLRGRLLVKAGVTLDRMLAAPLMAAVLGSERMSRIERTEAMRELDTFRQAMAGPVITIAFDAPWAPIYVIAAFLLNPWLGMLTIAAGVVLVLLAFANERATHAALRSANAIAASSYARQTTLIAHTPEIRALGMRRALIRRALQDRVSAAALQLAANFAGSGYATLIKTIRQVLQSVALGVGATLAVEQKISGGAIFAATLLMARALSPIEQLTQSWKLAARARDSFDSLCKLLSAPPPPQATALPRPRGKIDLEDVYLVAPGSERVALAGVSLSIAAGEVVAVVGLSGAGKSTLLAALAGALPALRGAIRIDGARLDGWDSERMADHIGYLPQDFTIFPGTVKENIARFSSPPGMDQGELDAHVVAVAQAVGVHEMILRLPQGYDTMLGNDGAGVSAGQAQRIALARALFGNPAILILDEPYASLDAEGQAALLALLRRQRERGVTIIMAVHQTDMLSVADKILMLVAGRVARFGPAHPVRPSVHQLEEKEA